MIEITNKKKKKKSRIIIISPDGKEDVIDVDSAIILIAKDEGKSGVQTAYRVFGSEKLTALLANLSFTFMSNFINELENVKDNEVAG